MCLVELAGEVELHAVREVAAVGELESEDSVAWGRDRGEDRGIGGCPRVWLHIGVGRTEEALRPRNG